MILGANFAQYICWAKKFFSSATKMKKIKNEN